MKVFAYVLMTIIALFQLCEGSESAVTSETQRMPAERFVKEMQLLARRHTPGDTKLKQQETLVELLEQVHSSFDGVVLTYEARVTAVDWKEGMATIRTTPPFRRYRPSPQMPFNITTTQPLQIPMERDDAAAIRPGAVVNFEGRLKFLDGKWGVVGHPPASQSLFWVRSLQYKSAFSLGTFVTEAYSVEIGGSEGFAVQPEEDLQ